MRPPFDKETSKTLCDPTCAGVGRYPRLVSDEEWIAGAKHVIKDYGLDFFLPTLLAALRESFGRRPVTRSQSALLDMCADGEGDIWTWFANLIPSQAMPEVFARMLCNPAHTGIGRRPRIMSDEQWMKSARHAIAEKEADYFLALLLDSLRYSLGVCLP